VKKGLLLASLLIIGTVWTVIASTVTMWGLGTLEAVWWPTWQWWGYFQTTMPTPAIQAVVDQWVELGGLAGTVFSAPLGYVTLSNLNLRFGRDAQSLYGDSSFATARQGRRSGLRYAFRPDPACLLLGRTKGLFGWLSRYVMLPGVEHVMLYAKTGAGKGISYVLSNCLNYGDSLVVLDLKHENEDVSAAHREESLGQKVFSFSPLSADDCTHCWNPVGHIHEGMPDYISRLQGKSFSFFPEVSDGKVKFWQDGARTAWLGIAVLLCETASDPNYQDDSAMQLNPGNIFRFFSREDGVRELTRLIDERRDSDWPYSQTCIDLLSDYVNGTDEVVSGIRKHVTSTMGIWFNPKIVAVTSRSDFDLRQLRREKMTIYVGVMPPDIEKLGSLLRMFFLQLFEDNTDSMPEKDRTILHRAHVMMDETTSLPQMRAIAEAVGFARGFWLHFSFIVQSKHQVEEKYKDNGAASLLENLGAEIVYATDNLQLMEEVSKRAGDTTIESVSRSMPRFFNIFRVREQSETSSLIRRPLILPQDVNELPTDEQYMFRATSRPYHLKRTEWFSDRNFKNLKANWVRPPRIGFTMARDNGSVSFRTRDDAASEQEAA